MGHIMKRLRELYEKRAELWTQLRWVLATIRPYLPKVLALFGMNLLVSVLVIGATLVNKQLIDRAASRGMFGAGLFALLVLLTIMNLGLSTGGKYLNLLLQERMAFEVRLGLYDHVLRSRWQQITARHSGDTLTRLTTDLGTVISGGVSLIPDLLNMLLRMLMAFMVLFSFDRLLALAALVIGPLVVVSGLLFAGRLRSIQKRLKENEAVYRSFMQESTEQVLIVKAFCAESSFAQRLSEIRAERLRMVRRRGQINVLMRLTMNTVFNGGYLLAFGWGIRQLAHGSITYGTLSVFLSLVSQIQSPIATMGTIIPELINVLTGAGRVMELEAMDEEAYGACPDPGVRVGLHFEGVHFRYDRDEVLTDVCLDIRPGETVGIVGETGAGKTTLIRLALGLLEPQRGELQLYGEKGAFPVSAATRGLLAYVPQGNTLLSGTIRENLTAGLEAPSDERLYEALRIAEAEQFVRELPEGVDTRIGERGIGLSEGQAQRIAIARALLRDAPVLILDEASASLDMQTERRIMENLRACTRDRTCLIITHRPSMLALCDRCVRLMGGRLREETESRASAE